jgi:hypothetical protein
MSSTLNEVSQLPSPSSVPSQRPNSNLSDIRLLSLPLPKFIKVSAGVYILCINKGFLTALIPGGSIHCGISMTLNVLTKLVDAMI